MCNKWTKASKNRLRVDTYFKRVQVISQWAFLSSKIPMSGWKLIVVLMCNVDRVPLQGQSRNPKGCICSLWTLLVVDAFLQRIIYTWFAKWLLCDVGHVMSPICGQMARCKVWCCFGIMCMHMCVNICVHLCIYAF